ncbi:hypothetical protein ID866_7010, partial [Astraeus odoratus]
RLKLEIKAELEGVTDLQPRDPDFEYFFKVICTSCHETHAKLVSLNRVQEREVSGSKHGTAHLVWRCGACKRENSAKFDISVPVRPYSDSDSGDFAGLVTIECRGLEFADFDPRGVWICKGPESGTPFEVEFQDDYWSDYDEKVSMHIVTLVHRTCRTYPPSTRQNFQLESLSKGAVGAERDYVIEIEIVVIRHGLVSLKHTSQVSAHDYHRRWRCNYC